MRELSNSNLCNGFKPIIAKSAHSLVLGTMPSVKSLENAFYYAHPRNAFWPIMHKLTGLPIDNEQAKVALIESSGFILWDVLQACERKGSLDSAIQNPVANDFEWLFDNHPELKTVIFNGRKAEQLFNKYVKKQQKIPSDLNLITLPSTSPANASMKLEDKQLFWQENLSHLL